MPKTLTLEDFTEENWNKIVEGIHRGLVNQYKKKHSLRKLQQGKKDELYLDARAIIVLMYADTIEEYQQRTRQKQIQKQNPER